jgi:transposase-like protein
LVLFADGLNWISEAIKAACRNAIRQACLVHLIRSGTRLVP